MGRTARAAVYEAPNGPFVLKAYPLRDVRAREALARVTMSTICRSDIHSDEGRRPNPVPCILGHEIIGVLEALGAGIERDLRGERLGAGDRVTWTEYFADGASYERDVLDLPQKAPGLREYGHEGADVDPHLATMVAVTEAAGIGVGDRVVVQGLGAAFRRAGERSLLRAAIVV
jgi:NADPH:quinone reductase-like Zn-dependent oxidoreductase